MNKLLLGIVALVFSTSLVFATDLPTKNPPAADPPARELNWTGFYAGFQGGYGWKNENYSITPNDAVARALTSAGLVASSMNSRPDGAVLGVVGGYDYQFNQWLVLGVMGDWSKSWIRGSSYSGGNLVGVSADEKIDWFATLRGRIGIPMGNFMPYATAGWAWAKVNTSFTSSGLICTPPITCGSGSTSAVRDGFVWGVGGEYRLDRNWSLSGEALFMRLGTQSTPISGSFRGRTTTSFSWNADQEVNVGIVQAKLTRRF